ncbi:MAG TPA: zf-HC2 domain-containing protein [Thermoanaerobaculia bacterium]|nr:zf-HC2 domain-containing protein [Thermoanaerobaculia bacterium]
MSDGHCFEGGAGEHDCRKIVLDLLGEYEAGTLPPAEREAIERHIAVCPPCVSFLSTYRATGRCLKSLKPSDVPDALAESILAFVRARRDRSK